MAKSDIRIDLSKYAGTYSLDEIKKVKLILWNDDNFWSDILFRHNGGMETPEQMKMRDKFAYNHCIGNMASMINQTIHTHKIIKQ